MGSREPGRWRQLRLDFPADARVFTDDPAPPLPGGWFPPPPEITTATEPTTREVEATTNVSASDPTSTRRSVHTRVAKRTAARLPAPRPLPEAVDAAHFGRDEEGEPVRPSPQEVREITEAHAETLAGHLADGRRERFEQGVAKYAESFGEEAARRLRSYVERTVGEEQRQQGGRGR